MRPTTPALMQAGNRARSKETILHNSALSTNALHSQDHNYEAEESRKIAGPRCVNIRNPRQRERNAGS